MDLDFSDLGPGTVVDYEVRAAAGAAMGGGMFTVSPDMVNAEGKVTVLTGFAGLELHAGDVVLVKLNDLNLAPADPAEEASHGRFRDRRHLHHLLRSLRDQGR